MWDEDSSENQFPPQKKSRGFAAADQQIHPADPFCTSKSVDGLYVIGKRRSTDIEALKLWKGLSGHG